MQALLQLGQHLLQIADAALLNLSGLTGFPGTLVKLIPGVGPGLYCCLSRCQACIRLPREGFELCERRLDALELALPVTQTTAICIQMLPGLFKIAACLVKMPL